MTQDMIVDTYSSSYTSNTSNVSSDWSVTDFLHDTSQSLHRSSIAMIKPIITGAVIGLGISLVPLCLGLVSVVGASISLYHAMLEVQRRENFVGNSGFSLASGVIGLLFAGIHVFANNSVIFLILGFIFSLIAFVFCLVSMVNDLAYRNYSGYFIATSILIALLWIGCSWYMVKSFQIGWDAVYSAESGGANTLENLGSNNLYGNHSYDTDNNSSGWSVQDSFRDTSYSLDQGYSSYEPWTEYRYAIWDNNHYKVYFADGHYEQMTANEYVKWLSDNGLR